MTEETSKPKKFELVDDAASNDPFDLARLRVSQNFFETAGVKKVLTTIPVRKPGPQEFVRVRPEPTYRDTLAFLELKDDKEIYLVDLQSVPELASECYLATLYTAMTRTGVLFMWPVKIPAADGGGRGSNWHKSAAAAAELGMTQWVRIRSNMSLGAYEVFISEDKKIPEPEWPDLTYGELCRKAFKDLLVNHIDHPAAKRLR